MKPQLSCSYGGNYASGYCAGEKCTKPWLICFEANTHGTCKGQCLKDHTNGKCTFSLDIKDFYQKIEDVTNRTPQVPFFEKEVYTPLTELFSRLGEVFNDLLQDVKGKVKDMKLVPSLAEIIEKYKQQRNTLTGHDIHELSKAINTNQFFIEQNKHLEDLKLVKKRVNKLYIGIVALIQQTRKECGLGPIKNPDKKLRIVKPEYRPTLQQLDKQLKLGKADIQKVDRDMIDNLFYYDCNPFYINKFYKMTELDLNRTVKKEKKVENNRYITYNDGSFEIEYSNGDYRFIYENYILKKQLKDGKVNYIDQILPDGTEMRHDKDTNKDSILLPRSKVRIIRFGSGKVEFHHPEGKIERRMPTGQYLYFEPG